MKHQVKQCVTYLICNASRVYDATKGNEGASYSAPDGSNWTVVQASEPHADGYQGALFRNDFGQYVYASRGTEPVFADVVADLQMGVNKLPDQLISARNDLALAKDLITQAGGNPLRPERCTHRLQRLWYLFGLHRLHHDPRCLRKDKS